MAALLRSLPTRRGEEEREGTDREGERNLGRGRERRRMGATDEEKTAKGLEKGGMRRVKEETGAFCL